MSWEAEMLVIPDSENWTGSEGAAESLIGQETPVSLNARPAGLVTVVAARYEPEVGIYATIEFGLDTPLGEIESG